MADSTRTKKSMAELDRRSPTAFAKMEKVPLSVILDDIRSANNVGSLFRTADGFALRHVYLCGITATPPHRDILKTALGATSTVSWSYHEECASLVEGLVVSGTRVYCLEQTHGSVALSAFHPDTDHPLALVVGNEVNGVQQSVIDRSHGTIEIEQFGTKHSLNVAVSAGIALWALSSQLR